MKKTILLLMSAMTGIAVPVIIAYATYATPGQKNSMPIWLLAVLVVVVIVILKFFITWLTNTASIGIRMLLLFGALEYGIVQLFFLFKDVEAGKVIISDNLLFLVITTGVAALLALWSTLVHDKHDDDDLVL